MSFKLQKNAKKKENTWKIKKQTFKTEKKRKQKKWLKKRNVKKGKSWEQHGLVPLHFSRQKAKKQNKSKQKANRKRQNQCKWTSSFFPLFDFPFFPLIFHLFASVFFGFCWCAVCFLFFCTWSRFFSSLLILRISYGLVKIILCSPKAVGISPIVTTVVL